jgi:hypothetical protein
MQVLPTVLSGLSLIAVVLIGLWTLKQAKRSVDLAKRSVDLASESNEASKMLVDLAAATAKESAEASGRLIELAASNVDAALRSAEASARAAEASIRSAAVAESDATRRRLEAVLDVVVEMRALFNEQTAAGITGSDLVSGSVPSLERLRLMRAMEARLVSVEEFADRLKATTLLGQNYNYGTTQLEGAINELKAILRGFVTTG